MVFFRHLAVLLLFKDTLTGALINSDTSRSIFLAIWGLGGKDDMAVGDGDIHVGNMWALKTTKVAHKSLVFAQIWRLKVVFPT